jgi:2-amino-4-hydroxy-6-hydroxymethyldihydropteridine diphosphokinase
VALVHVAAGSNIEPVENLRHALEELRARFADLSVSPAYRNPAFGFEGADFINLVVRFTTPEPLDAVLRKLRDVEMLCGRPRNAPKWAPRAMDLDILLYDDCVLDRPDVRLPRADLVGKAYMLRPAADLSPDLRHPTLDLSLRELWQAFDKNGLQMDPVQL